ncbi:MAG: DUF397 domain-containing protein [Pseudonocardiaceae bacterium]
MASAATNCVEVGITERTIFIRDSKAPRLTLAFSATEWKVFMADIGAIHPVTF